MSRLLLTQKHHLHSTLVPLVTNLSFLLHFPLEIRKYQMYFRIKKKYVTNPSCNEPNEPDIQYVPYVQFLSKDLKCGR